LRQEVRIILDENIGLKVYHELRRRGYHVQSILEECRGASDEEVVMTATKRGKIIVQWIKTLDISLKRTTRPG